MIIFSVNLKLFKKSACNESKICYYELIETKQAKQLKGNTTMKQIIFKTLQVLLILAFVIIGFVFVGAFVEYKTLNGANIYAGLVFATVLCSAIATVGFVVIKESILN